ncbi:transglycosylase SLT domain-containing protein [Flaviflagellibacter deserti]|uniref:Transglycosylase SLT domain-containing protein n=1 Tax=Flaviflagellibacter deserti TaxID=2267266 RepID=A0ABV9Z0G6_9HYPH
MPAPRPSTEATSSIPAATTPSAVAPLPTPAPRLQSTASQPAPGPGSLGIPAQLFTAPPVQANAFAPSSPAVSNGLSSLLGASRDSSTGINQSDVVLIKTAIAYLDGGKLGDAQPIRDQLRDRAARTLFDWLTIRAASRQVGFSAMAGFLNDNPDWPARALITRRAEEALYLENLDAGTIRAFLSGRTPQTGLGKLALARISDRNGAARLVKSVWREEDLTPDIESKVLDEFGGLLTADDHGARADHFLYDGETANGMRNAARAGSGYQAIAKARIAVARKTKDAASLMAAVPSNLRKTPSYRFAQINLLLAQNKDEEAAKLMVEVTRDPIALVDEGAWWEKRRWLARDMLDLGDARMAYRVAAGHGNVKSADIADAEWHAGWIALRFLKDPTLAKKHFAEIARVGLTPMTKARGDYWLGRAEEASGNMGAAQSYFASAARYGTYYYGQLARARLGGNHPPIQAMQPSAQARDAFNRNPGVRAIRILYAAGARDKAIPLFKETADALRDTASLTLLAEIAERNNDPRAQLLVGKAGIQNGFPVEVAAWPTNGVPKFQPVGMPVELPVVHAIARQESEFNASAVSHAKARGLLQMLPETAKRTAAKVGVPFDARKLNDATFNATLGAAHLGELIDNYDGSYIMTFAAYNAGPGRVKEWVARYGDPRDPNVDPVDWVERIPFTETRNYVQRVMENVQVYRMRFGTRAPQNIEADLRRGRS